MLGVALLSQAVGLVGVALVVVLAAPERPGIGKLALAAVGGAAGIVALAAFYRGLAMGTMSIVAPISATGAALPVAAGLASGDSPSVVQGLGMALAFGGVLLAAREQHDDAARAADARRAVGLALVAATGFGIFLTLLKPAAEDGVAWALLAARTASVAVMIGIVLAVRPPLGPALAPLTLGALVLVGAGDLGANALYATATGKGLLSVVAVLGSLYPVTTVLLARGILRERVRRIQEAGVGLVLAGVALIAAG